MTFLASGQWRGGGLKLSRRVGNKCDILCAFCSDSQESDFNSSSSSRGSQSTDEESGTYLLYLHIFFTFLNTRKENPEQQLLRINSMISNHGYGVNLMLILRIIILYNFSDVSQSKRTSQKKKKKQKSKQKKRSKGKSGTERDLYEDSFSESIDDPNDMSVSLPNPQPEEIYGQVLLNAYVKSVMDIYGGSICSSRPENLYGNPSVGNSLRPENISRANSIRPGQSVGNMLLPENIYGSPSVGNIVGPENISRGNSIRPGQSVGNILAPENIYGNQSLGNILATENIYGNPSVSNILAPENIYGSPFVGNIVRPENISRGNSIRPGQSVGNILAPENIYGNPSVGSIVQSENIYGHPSVGNILATENIYGINYPQENIYGGIYGNTLSVRNYPGAVTAENLYGTHC